MKKRKLLVFAIIAVALIFLGGIYLNSDVYVTHQVNTKVNRVIQARNTKELKRISNDKTTYKFLISLSNSTRCKDTSDFQGGTNKNAYYVTTLNKQKIGVHMYKASLFNWRIKNVEKQ
ncbi:hypothetical protein JH395_15665 (plasmid) [Lactiplantibacillus plantarum]|uniref:Uncharacterized protein n=1 Tax=Lactiplantibacillus plantarum TaxID=1590 RepID=A0AAX1KE42_LACPN|nr:MULTISPECIES: hypothetical protein [Lactobacillaceae]MCG0666183.1 hypothetical protein [Lactiplantibacillus plantarum]MCG0814215.1 hypothetical protein [Lactiplantibacillus plantarum]MCG0879589.1 hypothetical protein [Lactiplantibacillus plantarum]MCG0952106.1 hypothetical protein [Lactiplantibacillus plantarum]MCW3779628.1 hypothetical protein [Levilactobacillus namurensis]